MRIAANQKWLFIPVVIVGVILVVVLIKNKSQPVRVDLSETAVAVSVIEVSALDVAPQVRGTGNVQPSQVWQGVAQVSGKIVALHPQLKKGAIIRAGEVLLNIDPSDYVLAIAQAQTNLDAIAAQLDENAVREKNAIRSLAIEQDALGISEAELNRKRKLAKQGTLAQSELEKERRNLLAQQQSVQSLRSTINLLPVERSRLQAELARLKVQLQAANLDLERATIKMPFDGRIAQTKVEIQQFVRLGDGLLVVDGIAKAEVEVQVPMSRMASLVRSDKVIDVMRSDARQVGAVLGLSATVRLDRGEFSVAWPATVARISDTLDPRTRTLGVIVEIDQPYLDVQPGVRPPLVKGMFVAVELQGKALSAQIVIPHAALQGEQVYIVDANHRLQRRSVQRGISGPGYVTIEQGLAVGDLLIVSDVLPAIEGMLLAPIVDAAALARLKQAVGPHDSREAL